MEVKKMKAADILAPMTYAILNVDDSGIPVWVYDVYFSLDEAKRDFGRMTNADGILVEIDHDADTYVSTVDLEGNVVDSPTSEYDATLGALRYVYEMLDADELPTYSILDRLRGFCEHAGLIEFA